MSHGPAWCESGSVQQFTVEEDGVLAYVLTLKSTDVESGTTCSVVWQGGIDRRAAARQLLLAGLAVATGLQAVSEEFSVGLMHRMTAVLYDVPNQSLTEDTPF